MVLRHCNNQTVNHLCEFAWHDCACVCVCVCVIVTVTICHHRIKRDLLHWHQNIGPKMYVTMGKKGISLAEDIEPETRIWSSHHIVRQLQIQTVLSVSAHKISEFESYLSQVREAAAVLQKPTWHGKNMHKHVHVYVKRPTSCIGQRDSANKIRLHPSRVTTDLHLDVYMYAYKCMYMHNYVCT